MVVDTRALNRSAVLTELLRSRPATRRDIAATTGISAATVTRAVEDLLHEGIVREEEEIKTGARGRRAILLDLVVERAHVVGVDLGASNTRIIVADLAGNPLVAHQAVTPRDDDPGRLGDWLSGLICRLAGLWWDTTAQVRIGIPGAVRPVDGLVSNAPNLPQVESPGFQEALRRGLGRPLVLDNDANYALLGELRFGAAREASTAVMLTFGTGLGAGIAINGQVLRGASGVVGEFGQLPVGPLGSRLEHMVTGPGIMLRAAEAGVALSEPAALFDADGHPGLALLRGQFDSAVVIALVAAMVSCEPQCIVLGGQVGRRIAADTERYREAVEVSLTVAPSIVAAELGDFSGAAGAVAEALRTCYLDLGADEQLIAGLPASSALDAEAIRAVLTQG